MAGIFTEFGIDVLSLANNHMYDAGEQALLDTRALMLGQGIAVSGAGKNLAYITIPKATAAAQVAEMIGARLKRNAITRFSHQRFRCAAPM